jgi:GTPase SAR1 family protein
MAKGEVPGGESQAVWVTLENARNAAEALESSHRSLERGGAVTELTEAVGAAAYDLSRVEFRLLVVGAFNRGKSQLLNALLGREYLLSDWEPTNSVVVEVRYASETSLEVVGKDGKIAVRERALSQEDIQELLASQATDLDYKASRANSLVRLYCPAKVLKSGLVLVDTPGLESVIKEHDEVTHQEIKGADGVLFVSVVDPPIGATEKDFFEAEIAPCGRYLCVLNKVDRFESEPSKVKQAAEYLRESLGVDPGCIFPISAKQALSAREESRVEDENRSGILELDSGIGEHLVRGHALGEKIRIVCESVLKTTDKCGSRLTRIVAFDQTKEIDHLLDELEVLKEQKEALEAELTSKCDEAVGRIETKHKRFRNKARRIRDRYLEELGDADSMKDLESIQKKITSDFEELVEDYREICGDELASAGREFKDVCETSFRTTESRLQEVAKKRSAGTTAAAAAVGLSAGGVAFAAGTAFVPTLFGSVTLGGALSSLGLGSLATGTSALFPPLLPVVAIGAVGAVVGYWIVARRKFNAAKEEIEEGINEITKNSQRAISDDKNSSKRLLKDKVQEAIGEYEALIEVCEEAIDDKKNELQQERQEKAAILLPEVARVRDVVKELQAAIPGRR